MEAGNMLTIIVANIRMNYRHTIMPAILLLFVIPFIYGTANLDCLKSADCLERMVALIGIPMFTALVGQEHSCGLYEMIALRSLSFRFVVLLRMGLSLICTLLLIFAFEIYMCICGCSFPFFAYAFQTLTASMTLGLAGLFLSSMTQNTIGGYVGAFCFYFTLQTKYFAGFFHPVTNGISFALVIFLGCICLAILCSCKFVRIWHLY